MEGALKNPLRVAGRLLWLAGEIMLAAVNFVFRVLLRSERSLLAARAQWLQQGCRRGLREAYEVCGACHLPSGAGRPDGTFPQLAGQHANVIIKQIADIRAGLRDNPTMYPFAVTLSDAQELADVAQYIQSLCIPLDHGKGTGDAALLQQGADLYAKECVTCHGKNGEGDGQKFYPVLAGQHYKYLLRQVTDIRDGKRRNANPDMVKIVKKYSNQELDAVVEYMSSLSMPGSMCKAGAGGKKKK